MKRAASDPRSQGQTGSMRDGSASWGIVALISILSLTTGLLIGAFVLNSSKVPDANNHPNVEPQVIEEAARPIPPPTVPESQPSQKPTAEEELKTSIQATIESIEKNSAQMFVHSYLSYQLIHEYQRLVEREGRSAVDQMLSKRIFNEYRLHLQSALSGSIELNTPETIAIVTYKLKELPDSGLQLDKFALDESQIVEGEVYEGLGDDLSKMLEQASALLEDDKLQEFVANVYPISEVELLSVDQTLDNLLARINQPTMKAAMIRDLKAAAKADAGVQGKIAVVTLAPLVEGDPKRTFKFDLVEGNWRFVDLAAKERETIRELTVKLPESMTKGNTDQTILFGRNNSDSEWRIISLPDTLPEW